MFFSSWKRRKAGRRASKKHQHKEQMAGLEMEEVTIPNQFRCPISMELMKDPVTLSTGITYDRHCIERWIEAGNVTCPLTNQVLGSLEPLPNHHLRKMIQDWCVEHRSHGIERIPTPRTPLSSVQVSKMLSDLLVAAQQDGSENESCVTLVVKMKGLVKDSERNRRCIVGGGAARVLSAAFEAFSKASGNQNAAVLREILSALTLMFPLDGEAASCLASASSFHCLVWLLKCGDLLERRNAVLVLKEVLSQVDACGLAGDDQVGEAMEALVGLIEAPICTKATKASLMAIYCMVSSSTSLANEEVMKARFVKMGLVALLLDMLVDSEKGLCEKALGVLDALCSCKEGRQKACDHALTVPLLVKKLLRVSELATEFSVSILWKLMDDKREERDVRVAFEALGVGAFQKLLLLLQVGCCERTKEEATELLKLLNLRRDSLECIDSLDFKHLKRPF